MTSAERAPRWGLPVALAVFGLAVVLVFGELFAMGASRFAPFSRGPRMEAGGILETVTRADVVFEAWLVPRNARTLVTRPLSLFDAEHCAPAENTLTLGIPMITMGILAIPPYWITRDPVLTYNLTLVSLTLVAALAMYWLVVRWTGVPAAGIAAGLAYGFHATRLGTIFHPSVWDSAWTVFALLFAERLFAAGRWRDACGLAAAIALQVGASFYPLVGATVLTPPFVVWLLRRDGFAHVKVAQLLFVAVVAAASAAAFLGPYLLVPASADGMERTAHFFAPLGDYAPGGALFAGWGVLALMGVALAWRPRDAVAREIAGDPRLALALGAAIVIGVAAGDTLPLLPDLYGALAAVLPGLDSVRVVSRLAQMALLVAILLAGIGVAVLVDRAGPRLGAIVGIAAVGLVGLETLRLPSLGLERDYTWIYDEIRPPDEELALFEALEAAGNTGPILELPVADQTLTLILAPQRILRSAYHHRRTSVCFGSYLPEGRLELAKLGEALPRPDAIAKLRKMGFTTVLFHHKGGPDPTLAPWRARVGYWDTKLAGSEDKSVYELLPKYRPRP